MKRPALTIAGLFALAAFGATQSFFDDFNRADGPLGASWSNFVGSPGIFSNQAGGVTGVNSALVTPNVGTYTDTRLWLDAHVNGTALQFVALLFGHNGVNATANGLFIKVQQNGTGTNFNTVGFYTGSNSSNTTAVTGGAAFFTVPAFADARLSVYSPNATTVTLEIDTDFNGTAEQTYSRTLNLGALTLGNRFGIGFFNAGRGDDFRATVVPEPASLAVLGMGALALLRRRKRA